MFLGVYVPPRIAAVRFDDTAVDKKRKKEERQAKKLRDSELYRYFPWSLLEFCVCVFFLFLYNV